MADENDEKVVAGEGSTDEAAAPEASPAQPPRPSWNRPLLVGLGLLAASVICVIDPKTAVGAALMSGNAHGTLVVVAFCAMVVCGIVLDVVNRRREGVRLPLAPVMGAATVTLVLFALLTCAFLVAGGTLVGTIGGGLFCLFVLAGVCGGVGVSLAVSGWHTCVRGASWTYGLVYLVLSGVIAWIFTKLGALIGGIVPCALYAAVLAIAGAALLHVQVRVLDR